MSGRLRPRDAGATDDDGRGDQPDEKTRGARPLCPSSLCREGAQLIGIVQADGQVGLLPRPMPVDADFVARAKAGRAPEKRFRFASPCLECGCRQWTGSRCGVIDKVTRAAGEEILDGDGAADLPACGIRGNCRWYEQAGGAACRVCPLVVTNTLEEVDEPAPA